MVYKRLGTPHSGNVALAAWRFFRLGDISGRRANVDGIVENN